MACARPVIASDSGGPVEIIENGKNGVLVPPADPKILASKILEVLNNEKKTKQIGANARKTVTEKYSWTKIAGDYHTLYRTIIQ
jgi:glycosyltransferase involved in cell wall biosynthesis